MPACILVSDQERPLNSSLLTYARKSINKEGHLSLVDTKDTEFYGAVSFVKHCRLGSSRLFDDGRVCALFAGFLLDHHVLPWKDIIRALEINQYSYFKRFKAPFVIITFFRNNGNVFIVSDRCSQYPVYYHSDNNAIWASTSLVTFIDCLERLEFDEKWLTDFFLFNFPIHTTTCIQGVHRMPPASVLCAQTKGSIKISVQNYAPIYRGSIPDCPEKETKELTYQVFKSRIPKYYSCLTQGRYAASVTSGFDSRVSISFKPEDIQLDLYTYGIPGCLDIEEGKRISESLGFRHHYLAVDESKMDGFYQLTEKTIALSGGSLNALRSTLTFVYNYLADHELEAVVTGINADHFFRSSGVTPHTFSVAAIELVKNPKYLPLDNPYFSVFKDKEKSFEYYLKTRETLEKQYNWSLIPLSERQLTFAHYELATKHFGGEHSLADNYVTMVSPFWDTDIRELSYNSNLSTLALTPFIHENFPYWKRHSLFGYILSKHDKFKNLPVHGLKPKYYAYGNKYSLSFAKIYFCGIQKALKTIFPSLDVKIPAERSNEWVFKYLLPNFSSNFESLRLSKYLSSDACHNICRPGTNGLVNFHLAGKIVTAEMLLSLLSK